MKLKLALIIGLLFTGQSRVIQAGWFEKLTRPSTVLGTSGVIIGVTGLSLLGIRQAFKNKCEQMLEEYKAHLHQYHNSEYDANNGNYSVPITPAIATPIACGFGGDFYLDPTGFEVKDSTCCNIGVRFSASRLPSSPSRVYYFFMPTNLRLCYRNLTRFDDVCDL